MARGQHSTPSVLVALIIGGSILAAGWMVTSSLDRTATQLDGNKTSLSDTKTALESVAKTRPAVVPPRRGPDPNKRYTVKRNGSPAKGADTARVKIVEYSDFQ